MVRCPKLAERWCKYRGMKLRELAESGDYGLEHGFQGGVGYVKYEMVNKTTLLNLSRHSLGTVFMFFVGSDFRL